MGRARQYFNHSPLRKNQYPGGGLLPSCGRVGSHVPRSPSVAGAFDQMDKVSTRHTDRCNALAKIMARRVCGTLLTISLDTGDAEPAFLSIITPEGLSFALVPFWKALCHLLAPSYLPQALIDR